MNLNRTRAPVPSTAPPTVVLTAKTEVRPLPAPLRWPIVDAPARPVAARPQQTPVPRERVLDALPELPSATRTTMARRVRHQARMERYAEAQAIIWLVFGVLCLLVLVVVGTLVVGTMLGGWSVPVRH